MRLHETPSFLPEELAHFWGAEPDAVFEKAAANLNWAVQEYAFRRHTETKLDYKDIARELRTLALTCQRALHLCGVYGATEINEESIFSSLGPGALFAAAAIDGSESGKADVIAALKGVDDLRRWSVIATTQAQARANARPKGKGRPADADFERFMDRVAGVHEEATGDKARIEFNAEREPAGAFFNLLVFAHKRLVDLGLRRQIMPVSVAKAWQRYAGITGQK